MQFYLILAVLLGAMGLTRCDGTAASSATTTDEVSADRAVRDNEVIPIADYVSENPALRETATAVFAGGCFWCTEAAFERIQGVVDVVSGYTDGDSSKPSYKAVSSGQTGYTEAIYVFYDPAIIDYNTLLDVFFTSHDPTQLNRQGPDRGTQYRGGIYPQNDEQRAAAKAFIAQLEAAGTYDDPIVTEVKDYRHFWVAEGYHQNYYVLNPNQPYIVGVSRPKVEKVEKKFADRLKPAYR